MPYKKGFRFWVEKLIKQRETIGAKALHAGAKKGIKDLIESGCKLVGEISTLGLTWELLLNSDLAGIWFKEFLGNELNEKISCNGELKRVIKSVSGHAPHTLAPEILIKLKKAAHKNNLPFSIHLAESEDEIQFLKTGKGAWAKFLTSRSIDFSRWGLPVQGPVQYLKRLGILDNKTIAVHLIHTGKNDFETLLHHNTYICLCLRSNNNLHQKLPGVDKMLQAGIRPCLGTDSLASAESVSIFDEMKFISRSFPLISPADILSMATVNGAEALGFKNRYGSLAPEKCGYFIYLPINVSNRSDLLETIVNADFKGHCKIVCDYHQAFGNSSPRNSGQEAT